MNVKLLQKPLWHPGGSGPTKLEVAQTVSLCEKSRDPRRMEQVGRGLAASRVTYLELFEARTYVRHKMARGQVNKPMSLLFTALQFNRAQASARQGRLAHMPAVHDIENPRRLLLNGSDFGDDLNKG